MTDLGIVLDRGTTRPLADQLADGLFATRRVELVTWARERGCWLIEDDCDGELRYDVAPLPLLASLGPDIVVHLGTASKILTPSLGVGWLAGPPAVVDSVLAYRDAAGVAPSAAGQRVFTAMLSSGDLSRHLRRIRKELAARRDEVVSAVVRGGHTVLGDQAGAHVVVVLPDLRTERDIVERARTAGLLIDGLERCFTGDPQLTGLTLGYAAPASRADLVAALPILRRLLGAGATPAAAS